MDAFFSTAGQREPFRRTAIDLHTPLVELECTAPNQVLAARLRDRIQEPSRYSDADLVIGSKLAAQRESWPSAVLVSTSKSQEESARQALSTVETAWQRLP